MAISDPVPTLSPTAGAQELVPVEQWDSVIGSLHGVIFHGVERIKSAQVLAALGCSANKEQEGKRLEVSLPEELQDGCRLGIRWARAVLRKQVDPDNGNLLRAQGTAATLMVGSQLRADEARLRRQQSGDVLDRLEKLLRETEAKIPLEATALPPMRPRKERGKLAAPQDDVAPASRSPER